MYKFPNAAIDCYNMKTDLRRDESKSKKFMIATIKIVQVRDNFSSPFDY